ncbi:MULTISPECIES: ribonuclease R family protein [unclassified Sphingomonas]|uniref:ribonuclease R family protein n=1 Tax=unclassified Sphingomonas TaxID=196159 RepID=UPI0006F639CC|nr:MULTISPECIES: VacB/RNase II family 3'-5' exoribonuclease [unclassified Sphingomonas]KQM60002.1 ribonuclease R [Sphingomonas sp. Leaf16]KQN11531.1 ribonuclease R [Sphingomonas sp. Leaf29]KQN18721.1 ribonuclease R [Sphingomonas sp. Leaf32]
MVRTKTPPGLPTREQILDFIQTSETPAGKREIARAFALSAQQKISLKALLKDMADEGLIDSAPGRAFHKMGGLPKVTVLRVADVDDGGNVWAVPERWEADTPPPRVRVRERGRRSALGIGDRILARTEEAGAGWAAYPMKKLDRAAEAVLGVLRAEGDKLWLQGVDKKERREVPVSDAGGAAPGDLVLAEMAGRPPRITARVVERLGDPFEARSFSLIAIHKHGIPDVFSEEVLAEARKVAAYPVGGREDLRHLPIVAIDPIDARDHDDAVWATADDSEDNAGGWQAIVAIADVSFYVRPGSELDKSARSRGNSVYFPDRVVPMLPEILSADVCSLKAGQDRAALVCHLTIARDGTLKKWRFTRAVIRVAANIAYEHAQAAIDGVADAPVSAELIDGALKPLWSCWAALAKARAKREPLDLDLPERRIVLDDKGRILSVAPRERLDSMRLIEDYMIAANVAAAKALEAKKAPVMYRVHEPPTREKLVALKDYLETFDVPFALGQVIRPATFNHVLERIGEADFRPQVMEQILRTQTQAFYGPQNHGHFGLGLGSYAHFTSPIRRYADLIVHRSLVGSYGLGEGALPADDAANMERVGEAISGLERRAMEAERETVDRYVAAYLAEHVGTVMDARITGVASFGFFATVDGVGGDGLVPARDLGTEYFRFDESSQSLIGDQSGETFAAGQRLQLRLAEANPVSGALRFELPDGKGSAGSDRRKGPPQRVLKRRGRPANIRHNGRKR